MVAILAKWPWPRFSEFGHYHSLTTTFHMSKFHVSERTRRGAWILNFKLALSWQQAISTSICKLNATKCHKFNIKISISNKSNKITIENAYCKIPKLWQWKFCSMPISSSCKGKTSVESVKPTWFWYPMRRLSSLAKGPLNCEWEISKNTLSLANQYIKKAEMLLKFFRTMTKCQIKHVLEVILLSLSELVCK